MREVESRIANVEKRDPLMNTGFTVPTANEVDVSGLLLVNGQIHVTGDTTIDGTLSLPNGSVNNAALVAPVDGQAGNVSSAGFALTTSMVELAGQDITVPAGFTHAVGQFGASVFSYNPNTTGGSNGAGGDAIYCQALIGGLSSHANPVGVSGSSGYATSFSEAGFELTGLTPGSVFRLSVYGASAYQAIAANASNYANAHAGIIWLR
jgi:hypothetical protein